MKKIQYKEGQIRAYSEWNSVQKEWKPVAIISYFSWDKTRIDQEIHSEKYFSTFEQANEHAIELARHWIDKTF